MTTHMQTHAHNNAALKYSIFIHLLAHMWTHLVPLSLFLFPCSLCLPQAEEWTDKEQWHHYFIFAFHFIFILIILIWHMNDLLSRSSFIKPHIVCTFQKADTTDIEQVLAFKWSISSIQVEMMLMRRISVFVS